MIQKILKKLIAKNKKNEPIDSPDLNSPEDTVASVSLNGAQIAGLLSIVQSVIDGVLEYESAIVLIVSAFPFDEDIARKILGDKQKLDKKITEKVINDLEKEKGAESDGDEEGKTIDGVKGD